MSAGGTPSHLAPLPPARIRHVPSPAAAASPACPGPQSLTYTVVNSQNKKEKLSLLQDVNGYLLPGEMSALMG